LFVTFILIVAVAHVPRSIGPLDRWLIASMPIKLPQVVESHHFNMSIREAYRDSTGKLCLGRDISRRCFGIPVEMPRNCASSHPAPVHPDISRE
jgi:hypothetical protein